MSGPRRGTAPVVARILPTGVIDPSFGRDGLVTSVPRGRAVDRFRAVGVGPGGRIVAVGSRNEVSGGVPAGLVVAFRPDGAVDRSFGRNGRLLFPSRRSFTYTGLSAVEILRTGKLLVSGYRGGRLFVARLTRNGTRDRSFSRDGILSIDIGDMTGCVRECVPRSAIAMSDGGALILGNRPSDRTSLIRLTADGGLDRRFGRGGVIPAGIGRRLSNAHDLALQRDRKIVVIGANLRVGAGGGEGSPIDFVLGAMRLSPNGRLDRGFGMNGVFSLQQESIGYAGLTQPNGQVLAVGVIVPQEEMLSGTALLLARFRADN